MACRTALRHILSRYLRNTSPHDVSFGAGARGKPCLHPHPGGIRFNVAHTADLGLVAVSSGAEVGVDVEMASRPVHRAAARLAPREVRALQGAPPHVFLETWTRKEAFVKCTGEGIARSLRSFEVSVGTPPRLVSVDGSEELAKSWSMRAVPVGEAARATLVLAAPRILEVVCVDW